LPDDAPGARPKVIIRQVVSLAGVSELRKAGRAAIALVGGEPGEVPERWALANPMQSLPLRIPVVLAHNKDDRTVSVGHSRAYALASRAAGGRVTFLEFDTGGHRGPINPSEPAWKEAFREMDKEWSALDKA
jgi:acetyl esterase/lipase